MILESKYLKLTESNLRYDNAIISLGCNEKVMYKPVVWFTTNLKTDGLGLEGSIVDKKEIRITVKWKSHYQKWMIWSRKNKIDKSWAGALEKGRNPNSWWISEKIVPLEDIIKIENTQTGEVYYSNEELLAVAN
jgi:hypothetical protein